MLRLVWRHVRSRPYRSGALLGIVFIVAVGFSVLTASVERSQLVVQGFVDENARAAYDILVRPSAAVDGWESDHGLVRPGYLAGIRQGLTVDEWRRVQAIPGVDVAAPAGIVASIGIRLTARIDVTDLVDRSRSQQVIRANPTNVADDGLTREVDPDPRFVYVTDRPVAPTFLQQVGGGAQFETPDGVVAQPMPAECLGVVGSALIERQPSGRWEPLCGTRYTVLLPPGPNGISNVGYSAATFSVFQALPDGTFLDFTTATQGRYVELEDPTAGTGPFPVDRVSVLVDVPVWLPVGVIDPIAENQLVGLDAALLAGRPLPAGPGSVVSETGLNRQRVSMLATSAIGIDEQVEVAVTDLGTQPVQAVAPRQLWQELSDVEGTGGRVEQVDVAQLYQGLDLAGGGHLSTLLDYSLAAGAPTVVAGADGLQVLPVEFDPDDIWHLGIPSGIATGRDALQPLLADDVAFREPEPGAFLPPPEGLNPTFVNVTGVFQPDRIAQFSEFSEVSLELYDAAVGATGTDGNYELRPSTTPTGYLSIPPALLTSVDAAQQLTGRGDVIGAIRVRVKDVHGIDPASRERVRLVAEDIAKLPGVTVDIALGSSPARQDIDLPAGRFGRPDLVLHEPWSAKGVAVSILRATQTRSLLLFGLAFLACTALLANASSAAVRERRRELAVLAALGWGRSKIFSLLISESMVIGLVAGGLALPVGLWLSQTLTADSSLVRGLWAVPAAVLLTGLAALRPALGASRVDPAQGMVATTTPVGRRRLLTGWAAVAVVNVLRNKGRSAAAVLALAVSVATVSFLVVVLLVFNGTVVGTLLGDAVSVRVGPTDLVLLVVLSIVALAGIADVLYVGLRERAGELALLRAIGWSGGHVLRVVLAEGALLSVAGALLGAVLAGGLVWAVTGALTGATMVVLVQVGLGAAFAGVLACLVPGITLPRLSPSLLAEEG